MAKIKISCDYCGKTFERIDYKINKNNFCSRKCCGLNQSINNIKKSIGKKYQKITVISFSHTKNKKSYVNCICDCGNKFVARLNNLKSGGTKTCGNCISVKEKFMSHVTVINKFLWIWNGCKLTSGYGKFGYNRKTHIAHRFAYELFIGKIPEGKICCHHDDKPYNVSPYNLFISDNKGNSDDMVSKCRQAKGEKSGSAKLNNKKVSEIKALYSMGKYSVKEIANIFGVVKQTIYNILNKKAWKNI